MDSKDNELARQQQERRKRAVSYTHLDVYKRQVVFYIIGAILKVILSCAFKAMEDRQKKAEAAEAKTDDSEVFDNDNDNDKPIS